MAKAIGKGGIDYPDFIQATTPHSNPVEITLAELAVRLGFPHVFERTGNVLFYETFEYGISGWNPLGNIAANTPLLASQGLLKSPYSVKMVCNGTAGSYSLIRKDLGYPYLTTFGYEFSFLPSAPMGAIRFSISLFTGAVQHLIRGHYEDFTYNWAIWDDTAAYQDVLTYNIGANDHHNWHTVKLVADIVNERYSRLLVDNLDVGLSNYKTGRQADVTTPFIYMEIYSYMLGARVYDIYVDNVILTINEPQ